MSDQDAILEKIRRLILHAEGTKNVEEAANYWAKAQELMQKYAIDEAMVQARNNVRGTPVQRRIEEVGIKDFRTAKVMLLNRVARANRCRMLDCHEYCIIVGMDMDTRFVEMLYISLILQGWTQMKRDRKADPDGRRRPNVYANNWLEGYTDQIAWRLHQANKKIEGDYKTVAGDPNTVALVLKDVRLAVEEKFKELFPDTRKGSAGGSRHYMSGAQGAGREAGEQADLTGGTRGMREPKKLEG